MNLRIKNALVSLSDKENIISLLRVLKKYNVKIISSGGTYKSIKKLGYDCTELSKYTGFKEMLDGRVKTLHPKIHAGILHDRQNKTHKNEMYKKKFPAIDLIVVNFYPFQNVGGIIQSLIIPSLFMLVLLVLVLGSWQKAI